jgi:hypothetical protein
MDRHHQLSLKETLSFPKIMAHTPIFSSNSPPMVERCSHFAWIVDVPLPKNT